MWQFFSNKTLENQAGVRGLLLCLLSDSLVLFVCVLPQLAYSMTVSDCYYYWRISLDKQKKFQGTGKLRKVLPPDENDKVIV